VKPSHSLPISAALPSFAFLPIQTVKELHVIIIPALCGCVCSLLAGLSRDSVTGLIWWAAFPLSCTCIGALAFGHDFTHRTLGTMMALPIAREQLWRKRMRLCFLLILPITLILFVILQLPLIFSLFERVDPGWISYGFVTLQNVVAPAMFSGLFLAPWLTIVSRSPLFGAVFATILPLLVYLVIGALIALMPITDPAAFVSKITTATMLCLWIAGWIFGKRAFMRLEAIDRPMTLTFGANLFRAKSANVFRRQHPAWQLLKKEILIQGISIAAGVVCAGLIFAFKRDQVTSWVLTYPPLLTVLIGAIGSAEERQIGALEWHASMPIPRFQQWAIKVAVVFTLTLTFGILLPAKILFWRVASPDQAAIHLFEQIGSVIAAAILLAAVSLWVSSLCRTTLKAVLLALPVGLALFIGISGLETFLLALYELPDTAPDIAQEFLILFIATLAATIPALWFGMINHFSAEPSSARVIRQVACFAATIAVASFVLHYLAATFGS
jgi:hypothetical protein